MTKSQPIMLQYRDYILYSHFPRSASILHKWFTRDSFFGINFTPHHLPTYEEKVSKRKGSCLNIFQAFLILATTSSSLINMSHCPQILLLLLLHNSP